MRLILISLALFILGGCGHFLTTDDYRIQPYQGIATPKPDTAVVVFLWTDRKAGAATLAVMQNHRTIGALQGGTYFSHVIEPGPSMFAVDSGLIEKSREQVSLAAAAGKTYFIHYTPGGFYIVAKLELIAEEVAMAQLPGLSTIHFIRH
jgi:hypothetical protein